MLGWPSDHDHWPGCISDQHRLQGHRQPITRNLPGQPMIGMSGDLSDGLELTADSRWNHRWNRDGPVDATAIGEDRW